MSLLLSCNEDQGYVTDCDVAQEATQQYRNDQDFIVELLENIVINPVENCLAPAPALRKSLLSEVPHGTAMSLVPRTTYRSYWKIDN